MPYIYQKKEGPSATADTPEASLELTEENDIRNEYHMDDAAPFPSRDSSRFSKGQDKNNLDLFFSFIAKNHLVEAQEFRRKGYNSQAPYIDDSLLKQLQEAVRTAKSNVDGYVDKINSPASWLSEQIEELEKFINRLTEHKLQYWVNMSMPKKNGGSRADAQSMLRHLGSTLQGLTQAAQALSLIVDYSTTDNLRRVVEKELIAEIINEFRPDDTPAVTTALEKMKGDHGKGNTDWATLVSSRITAKEESKWAIFATVKTTASSTGEKAKNNAVNLVGTEMELANFFHETGCFLQTFSCQLMNKAKLSDLPSGSEMLQAADTPPKKPKKGTWLERKLGGIKKAKTTVDITASALLNRGKSVAGKVRPAKTDLELLDNSIIRSVLWQLQQPVINLQRVSQSILFKAKELKKINTIFSSTLAAHDNEKATSGDFLLNNIEKGDVYTQLRYLTQDKIERETPEGKKSAKLAILNQLFASDIANARELVNFVMNGGKDNGGHKEDIASVINHQFTSYADEVYKQFSAKHFIVKHTEIKWRVFKTHLLSVSQELVKSVRMINEVIASAERDVRDFSDIKRRADEAFLSITKVKEKISALSVSMTEKLLDDNARGARLAKHWANLAKEWHGSDNWSPPEPEHVLALLRENGLLKDTLSSEDPGGYLFATRLAGELKNAHADKLVLPMSPDEYVALEKNLIDFIVRWGQRRTSRGTARLVVELCFEQAIDTVAFSLSNVIRIPYKVLKASIMIPYKVNKVNNYTMPGQDKPYKAIYGLLGKKLGQLGFKLLITPVPGVVKFVAGGGITAAASGYNRQVKSGENTVSAVYERVAEGKKSRAIKMDSWKTSAFDTVLDAGFIAGAKGVNRAWQSGASRAGGSQIPGERDSQRSGRNRRAKEVDEALDRYDYGDDLKPQQFSSWQQNPGHGGSKIRGKRDTKGSGRYPRSSTEFDETLDRHYYGDDFKPRQFSSWRQNPGQRLSSWKQNPGQSQALTFEGNDFSFMNKIVKITVTDGDNKQHDYYFSSSKEAPFPAIKEICEKINKTIPNVRAGEEMSGNIEPIASKYRNKFWVGRGSKLKVTHEITSISSDPLNLSRFDTSDEEIYNDWYEKEISDDAKKLTYQYAINYTLGKIMQDESLSQQTLHNAYLASIRKDVLIPVDINGVKLANIFFIPDEPGAKKGILVNLNDDENFYTYIANSSDIPDELSASSIFNSNNKPMNIFSLSEHLNEVSKEKYRNEPHVNHNRHVFKKAILGSNSSNQNVPIPKVPYRLHYTWAGKSPSEYLKIIPRPFETLAGQGQLVASAINEDSIPDTNKKVKKAEHIGSWVDVTMGAVISISPAGVVLNGVQSLATIGADLAEGKAPDPLDVAGLVMNCIPSGKIAARVGKFSKVGEKGVKYLMLIGDKTIDLAGLSREIKTAVDTGEPLAIYQALLTSGMSVKNAYHTAKNMSSKLKLEKTMEESASLEQLETIHNSPLEPSVSSTMQARTFKVGKTEILGRVNNGEIEISRDEGVTWEKGSKVHLLAYRLQNAGGTSKSVQLNGRIYRNHNAVSSQAQELNSIKTNKYDIYSLESDSTATAVQQGARRDFEAGAREYNYDEFSQFDSLSLSKKIEGLKLGTLEGQTLTHRQKGVLWKKAHDQFWEDQARKQVIRGQEWVNSAKKNYNATGGEVSPQGAYLRGKNQGECEPATILMARAQREGRGNELARSLTGLFDEPDNALGASLGRLRSQSGIKGEVMAGVRLSALETSERTLFPGSTDEAISVRLELKEGDSGIRNHVVLLSRRKGDSGNYIYSFFDPNYGYVEFSKYNDMANFVKKRVQIQNKANGGYENSDDDVGFSTISNQKLDAVTQNISTESYISIKKISSNELDDNINRASKADSPGYSQICYRGAINDAKEAGVINSQEHKWLIDEVARRDGNGEIMGSDKYRKAFDLQNKSPMTNFSDANITESGFMHIGERQPDGTVHYDHVVYVHVDENGTYLYQVNGSDFLMKMNGTDKAGTNNKIGKYVSKSHYKHRMDASKINLFNEYFTPTKDNNQSVFTFTPARDVKLTYARTASVSFGHLSEEGGTSAANRPGALETKSGVQKY